MTAGSVPSYVVDASVLVAYFVESDVHRNRVLSYWEKLEANQCHFHIPMLAVVETAATVYRSTAQLFQSDTAVYRIAALTLQGSITQYPLDAARTEKAVSMAVQYNLRGADAVYAALADELQIELLTADSDFRSYPKVIDLSQP